MPQAHLFIVRGTRKRGFQFFQSHSGTRLASGKWKDVNGKSGKINELILKTKADLKKKPDNIIVIVELCFLLID